MTHFFKIFCLFLLIFCLDSTLKAQQFLRAQGKVIVNESGDTILLRGMGLGGWMLQEGYMLQTAGFANAQHKIRAKIEQLIGKADTDAFYEAWLSNHVRKIDIDSLKAWGFNSVRLPMHYNLFTLPIEDEPAPGQNTWLEKGFELTDSLLSWCRQNQMYVVLDLHAAPGGQGLDEGISDYDPSKPSLWESQENRDKTVALWKRIAQRYRDEAIIAGYDLINETNWNMPGNAPLRDLYFELTQAIREVDSKHILFIEGNWFANDFTGLTPPWDDNMVYSPHKYWSTNDQASIQWVLDIRDLYDVPLYFGEWGENSNPWFRDAIRLFEEHQIGWAVWPMKKIESIAGPLSVPKSQEYQTLLDHWNGNIPAPSASFAKSALMGVAEGLKLENCIYQKDVIDAMFRQQKSDKAIPYRTQVIPGIVYATDYDMGPNGSAYFDTDIADFRVSTGNFTAWNSGWSYRNDGVDIEKTEDNINSNGYNVGWLTGGEWMQYDVEVLEDAIYDIKIRVSSNAGDGAFHFSVGQSDISGIFEVPNTSGWQNWQSIIVPNVVLAEDDHKLRFNVDEAGFNLNSFEFVKKASSTSVPTDYLTALTLDEQCVQLSLNKPLVGPLPAISTEFQILVDGNAIVINSTQLQEENPRIIVFKVDHNFKSEQVIRISYSGEEIKAFDGTALASFSQKPVRNTIAIVHAVPGRVEAEDYFFQSGIQLENTTDEGGGQNIGFLDVGDYLDYYIDVAQAGLYEVNYRTAALSETGQIELQIIDEADNAIALHSVSFPPTGGWQDWTNTQATAMLPAGKSQLRVVIKQPLFNVNWFEFDFLSSNQQVDVLTDLQVFPNPTQQYLNIKGSLQSQQGLNFQVVNLLGQVVVHKHLDPGIELNETLDLTRIPQGHYILLIRLDSGAVATTKFVKLE